MMFYKILEKVKDSNIRTQTLIQSDLLRKRS